MEQFWFPLKNVSGCTHVRLKNVVSLIAEGAYTKVRFVGEDGSLQNSTESGCLKHFKNVLDHGFIMLRRNVIVNRSYVAKHGAGRIVVLSTGSHFTIPKAKWKHVKQQLSKQMVIPFSKKGDSFNQKGDS